MDISHKVSDIVQNVLVIVQSAVSAVQNITQRLDQILHKQSLNFRPYLGIGVVIMCSKSQSLWNVSNKLDVLVTILCFRIIDSSTVTNTIHSSQMECSHKCPSHSSLQTQV